MLDLSAIGYKDIYCTDEAAARQGDRYASAVKAFGAAFETASPQAIFSAPGRTEVEATTPTTSMAKCSQHPSTKTLSLLSLPAKTVR